MILENQWYGRALRGPRHRDGISLAWLNRNSAPKSIVEKRRECPSGKDERIGGNLATLCTHGGGDIAITSEADDLALFANDRDVKLCGTSSLRATVNPYSGGRVSLLYPSTKQAGWKLADRRELVFWVS